MFDLDRFKQQQMNLLGSHRTVLDASRNDDELALMQCEGSIPELYLERAFQNQEKLVFAGMRVPDEFALNLGEFHLLAIEVADYTRIPIIGKKRQLLFQIDDFHRINCAIVVQH